MATITPKIGETGFGKSPLGQAAQQFFEREILPHLGEDKIGHYLVIDVEISSYEIDTNDYAAGMRAYAKNPNGKQRYGVRIGYPTVGRFGKRLRTTS